MWLGWVFRKSAEKANHEETECGVQTVLLHMRVHTHNKPILSLYPSIGLCEAPLPLHTLRNSNNNKDACEWWSLPVPPMSHQAAETKGELEEKDDKEKSDIKR